jgi:hypothetical protein
MSLSLVAASRESRVVALTRYAIAHGVCEYAHDNFMRYLNAIRARNYGTLVLIVASPRKRQVYSVANPRTVEARKTTRDPY